MSTPILATKLYTPPPRPKLVPRPQLIRRLNEGLHRKLTLISAPAGFGKTTLVSEWVAGCRRPTAWLSLDERDNDSVSFLTYFIAALRTIAPDIGESVLGALQSPQPPSTESILTALLNEMTCFPYSFILVLDDYHLINAAATENVLAFILEHMPTQMHLAIATREDPDLQLARLRARGQLTELRAADLRFTSSEAAGFLNRVMGLNLSEENIAVLENRTEGWIAGLQLAAISMQGLDDSAAFIKSFTGSHYFVMDYLVQEVLTQQPDKIQTFLLCTSILDRLCGPLCDAVLQDPSNSGQSTLEYIEQTNLFIVPLDSERCWYRYHHLFSDLLRQRLQQTSSSAGKGAVDVDALHRRASQWYADNDLQIEAFHHAALANDIEGAERLIEDEAMPLHFRGTVISILNWLESLPPTLLAKKPSLWIKHASLLLVCGQTSGVEQKLQAAETVLQSMELDDKVREMIGRVAAARSTLALSQYQFDAIIAQSKRALEYLHPDSLFFRNTAVWTLGNAYEFLGDRTAAREAYTEALSLSRQVGNTFLTILSIIGVGTMLELENQLRPAAECYQKVVELFGDHPLPAASDAYLGLARIFYQWNDLDGALQHGEKGLQLANQYDNRLDRFVICEMFLVRLKLARGDIKGAEVLLTKTNQIVQQHNFVHRMSEAAEIQILLLLHRGNIDKAAHLAEAYELPISQARVHLAQGDTSAALALLESVYGEMEAKGWNDKKLKIMVLQSVALHMHGEKERAVKIFIDALMLAEPGGFIRLFVDEGTSIAELLKESAVHGVMQDYISSLLTIFKIEHRKRSDKPYQPLVEPLSRRELEVLQLIARGLSNSEIGERLSLALDTVKGHNRNIFGKLQVKRRTEAVARARELDLL